MKYLTVLIFLLVSATAFGQQATVNPTTVEFTASADHNTTVLGGTEPMLNRYELRMFLENASQPISNYDLGKPTPDGNNKITVVNPTWFISLAMNVRHVARIAAIGPYGETVSEASNPFGDVKAPVTATNLVVK